MLVLSRFPVVLSGDYQFTLLPPSENENKTIDELYLLHIEALKDAGLSTPNSYPTLPYLNPFNPSQMTIPLTQNAPKQVKLGRPRESLTMNDPSSSYTKRFGAYLYVRDSSAYMTNMAAPG